MFKFFRIFKTKVIFHMKSGKTITIKEIIDWSFKRGENGVITSYDLKWAPNKYNVIINLAEIEAVEVKEYFSIF